MANHADLRMPHQPATRTVAASGPSILPFKEENSIPDQTNAAIAAPRGAVPQVDEMLEVDGVRVHLSWIGEGIEGGFDAEDPDDVPLLRFDVSRRAGSGWSEVDGASYCTQVPATTGIGRIHAIMGLIMAEVGGGVRGGKSVRRACERLSWIGPDAAGGVAPTAA